MFFFSNHKAYSNPLKGRGFTHLTKSKSRSKATDISWMLPVGLTWSGKYDSRLIAAGKTTWKILLTYLPQLLIWRMEQNLCSRSGITELSVTR
jgi:hypothetical protein